jgi:large conductance mechanosensitive channel
MSVTQEFKTFAMKGNVMDLAVAVIIGAAFGAIVSSLVDDVLMPLLGILTGGIDFTHLSVMVGSANLTYGRFVQALVNFLIIAAALFMVVKGMNAAKKKAETPPPVPGPTKE